MFIIIYEYIKWNKGVYKKHGLLKNKKGTNTLYEIILMEYVKILIGCTLF